MRRVCCCVLFFWSVSCLAPGNVAAQSEVLCSGKAANAGLIDQVLPDASLMLADARRIKLQGLVFPLDAVNGRPIEPVVIELANMFLNREVCYRGNERDADRYGRIPAQVFVRRRPHGTVGQTGKYKWVQEAVAAAGLAQVYTFGRATARLRVLFDAEARARRVAAGFWGSGTFKIKSAHAPDRLLSFVNSFQIVEGKVFDVAVSRRGAYLNFGPDRRTDFTVAVSAAHLKRFKSINTQPAKLRGGDVQVRGWIVSRDGPLMVATRPSHLRLLDGATR